MRLSLGQPVTIKNASGAAGSIAVALQRSEIERWWPIIKAANIKGQ